MNCCFNCFSDSHLQRLLCSVAQIGECDFCHSKDVHIANVDNDNEVVSRIIELLELYEISEDVRAKKIEDALSDDWKVFNLSKKGIRKFIETIYNSHQLKKNLLEKKSIIPELYDEDFLSEHSITGGLSWEEFADYIKNVNRFHTNFNSSEFASYLSALAKTYEKGTVFYRGRIAKDSKGYKTDEMMAPPKERRTAGRINPEGMLALYMSLDPETILYEIRANVYDYITIGKMVAKQKFRVVDLSKLENISPFDYGGEIENFAVNFNIFQDMAREISKPLRRNDSQLEYLPTQFITEFIKGEKYDGVAYRSTISDSGINIALFDESLVECFDVDTVEVASIEYTTI